MKKYPINYGLNGIFNVLQNNTFLSLKENLLTCHALETGTELWRLDFTELLGSEKAAQFGELIVAGNKLFFFLSDYNKGAVFCVDTTDGSVLYETNKINGWLQKVEDKIYFLSHEQLKVLDINTFKEKIYDLTELINKHDLNLAWNKYVVDKEQLYFVSENTAGGGAATVGIIDLNSLKLQWKTAIEIEEGAYWIKEIKVAGNKLYVHTQGGTLHIFEKEENNTIV